MGSVRRVRVTWGVKAPFLNAGENMGTIDIKTVAKICKKFRIDVLGITNISEFARLNQVRKQNVYAFEDGRANSILHLFLYCNLATEEQLEGFYDVLFTQNSGVYDDGN